MDENISSSEETLYDCVQSLISADSRAKSFYMSLGDREQGSVLMNGSNVCSYEGLQSFVRKIRL